MNPVAEASLRTRKIPEIEESLVKSVEKLESKLLPMERSQTNIVMSIGTIKGAGVAVTKASKLGLPLIDPEIFGWTKNRLPVFAAYDIKSEGKCEISTSGDDTLPSCLKNIFARPQYGPVRDFVNKSNKIGKYEACWYISWAIMFCIIANIICYQILGGFGGWVASFWSVVGCIIGAFFGVLVHDVVSSKETLVEDTFIGLLPCKTREKISKYKGEFQEVFILAEAHWKVTVVRNPDPLVIGFDGYNFWLIDKFDLTSVEAYAAAEFAT
jgi:hypothetical protein